MMTEKIKEYYERLNKLRYSEENIAELYSIINGLISYLKALDNNPKTNKCLHFITLTRNKEFTFFEKAPKSNWEYNFKESKSNLIADLRHFCS